MKQKATKPIIFPNCRRHRRNGGEAWIERTNPLTRLSLRVAQNIYDSARTGAFTRLQYIYSEVERTDPILLLCVERRLSALSSLGWRISLDDDSAEANRQKEVLENLLNTADNLSDAIEHLGLAFFRGFSFAAPFMKDGRLSFALPPTWEFNRSLDGTWWHNPLAIEGGPGGEGQTPFDPCNVLFIERKRPVDYPALALFIRRDVAEDQWGRFIDRYGIPPVILEMPPVTNELDAEKFAEAARSIYEALCGSVPNGTKVNTLAEARGTDPFSAFVEHQEKTIVRLCTGGTLGSIAEAGSGTLAGNAQADVWRDIVSRDAVKIGEEFTRWFGRFLFPEGMLVKFELGLEKRNTPGEVFDMAVKAKTAGYIFTKEYLESETGAELEKDVQNTPQDPLFNPGTPRLPLRNAATAFKTPKSAFKTARKDSDAQGAVSAGNGSEGVLEAFCKDGSKAAQEVLKLLEDPTAEKAAELIEKLPSLLPEDPALAAVIAEAMAEEFGSAESKGEGEVIINSECRAKNPATCHTHGMPREARTKGFKDRFGSTSTETLAANPKMNLERGKAVITSLLGRKAGEEPKAMFRNDTGWIGIDYGKPGNAKNKYNGGYGLSHILAKHKGAENSLADVLQYGEAFKHPTERSKVILIKGNQAAVLSKKRDGRLLITDYANISEKQRIDYTSKGKYHAKGEN